MSAAAPLRPAANAVHALVALLPAELAAARLSRERLRKPTRLAARYELDLCAFLNRAADDELRALCAATRLRAGTPGAMRQRLWAWGAALERTALGADQPAATVQPTPIVIKGRLALPARRGRAEPARGVLPSASAARCPPAASYPRPVPPPPPATTTTTTAAPAAPAAPTVEPATLDALLARADALLGVRLGARGRDKGQHGQRVATLLGLARSSDAAPDWRGEVEVKTLAVARALGGRWRLKDTPALSMRGVDAGEKLARVLWVIRVDDADLPGAPVLSWYYQELDVSLRHAFEAARHLRPKGGANTTGRGWYLRRAFFDACGLMRSLNGD